MTQTLTLVGTLGRTQQIQDTNPFAVEVDEHNDIPRIEHLPHDIGGPFAIFAIAPQGDPGDPRATTPWTRCIVLDVESPAYRRLCEARPGELVAVTGRWGTYTTTLEETGEHFTLDQLVVEDLRPVCGPVEV